MQAAPRVVFLRILEETVGIDDMPGDVAELAEVAN